MSLLFSVMVLAAIDTFTFTDQDTQDRFKVLTEELRCPKCDGQSIAGSNAPIANDLRSIVYQKLESGESDQQIVDFMVDRYGEFVLYRPKTTGKTQWLWYGPIAFGVIGVLVLGTIVLRSRSRDGYDEDLDEEHQSKLDVVRQMLDEKDSTGRAE
ncbi:cytochrome c-type biogenesis protein CcmH [Sansalvadorimonas verongulae]|nr:cytochrome c-type biogenesis protein CcmH [Sansalvadorimonas verongulae]